MRSLSLLLLLLAALALPAVANAQLPVGYVGPTYFTDADRGGASWSVRARGATIPVDPYEYGLDPDASVSGGWTFSDPNNAQGTVSPGIGFWPSAFTPIPTSTYSRAVMGESPAFMLAIQRRYRADDFVVFVLDFAGDDRLSGQYYTCGPAARQPNPPSLHAPDQAHGYYAGPVYAEGTLNVRRGGSADVPPASDELYGYYGAIGGESPYCDVARRDSRLWLTATNPPAEAPDTRRTTRTEAACNRGPNPGDPFTCTVTVGDSDQRLGAVAPFGLVDLKATAGSLPAFCSLTSSTSSPATATCTFTYVNPGVGIGNAIPITATYRGSATHKGSSGGPQQAVPDPKQPDTSGDPPIVCGAPPLPSCVGLIHQPDPIQTCVGNVGGACVNTVQQFDPIKVCIANVSGACDGFTGSAVYAGEIKDTEIPIEIVCEAELFSDTRDYEACRSQVKMTTEEASIVKEFDALFRAEVRIRYAIWQAAKSRATVRERPRDYTVADVSNPSLQRTIRLHNERARAANAVILAITSQQRKRLGIGRLTLIDLDQRISAFDLYAEAPDGNSYYDPRTSNSDFKGQLSAAKPKRVKGYGPKRRSVPKGVLTIGTSKAISLRPGQRVKVAVPLNKLGRALVRSARVRKLKTIPLGTEISITSPNGRFAPTTVQQTVKTKLAPRKR